MSPSMVGHDLYLRRTSTTGAVSVHQHRVWSTDLFLAAQQREVDRENAEVTGDGPRLAAVAVITREQYRALPNT